MELTNAQLKLLYQSVIKQLAHPDPVGYIARALLETGGDPMYYGADDRVGFMPIDPWVAVEQTGISNMTDLNDNVMATVMVDKINFKKYGSIDSMIRAFQFGENEANNDQSVKINAFIKSVNDTRSSVLEIVEPRMATLKDVITILEQSIKSSEPKPIVTRFVKQVLEGV